MIELLLLGLAVTALRGNKKENKKRSKHKFYYHGRSFDSVADMEWYKNVYGYK